MEIIKLKNGTEEVAPLVNVVMMSLRALMKENPIVFYEIVMKCRDRNHELFGNTGQLLKDLSLIQFDESVRDFVKNVVLSATKGDGLNMILENPAMIGED